MRQSRRAGLVARYVRWEKYTCRRSRVQSGYSYYQTDWVTDESGKNADIYVQGSTDYEIVFSGGQYIYAYAGDQSYVSAEEPGAVYDVAGTKLYKMTVFGSDGSYRFEHRSVVTSPMCLDVYSVESLVGTALASDGAYPDEGKGYTYVTTEDEYTIMKDGDDNYFAYLKLGR